MKKLNDGLADPPRAGPREGESAVLRLRWWYLRSVLITSAMLLAMPCSMAREDDGNYRLKHLSGILFIKGRKSQSYSYAWGGYGYVYFHGTHRYPIPPEGILAAALGHGIEVRNGRIRIRLDDSRSEISKVIRRDPRLRRIMFFSIKSLPVFPRFKTSEDGVSYANSLVPLRIEVALKDGSHVTAANSIADYRAEIRGDRLLMKVSFRGNGGPLGKRFNTYDIRGTARITTVRK